MPIMYIMHETVTDSVWHHPSVFLKRLFQHDMLKALFWCMCPHTAVTVYTAIVWRVDPIEEDGMRPLTLTQDPQRPLKLPYLIGLSDTVIISRAKNYRDIGVGWGGFGGGVMSLQRIKQCWAFLTTSFAVTCIGATGVLLDDVWSCAPVFCFQLQVSLPPHGNSEAHMYHSISGLQCQAKCWGETKTKDPP